MLGVLLAALSTPQPQPPPLKTITHIRSSPFCTTLRENVGQTVKALIRNNIAFGQAKSLFLKMAHDRVTSADRTMVTDLNVQGLGPLIGAIAQDLSQSNALLNDARRFSAKPNSADERELAEIRRELRAIVDRQNEALNVLSGTYFSYNGNRLMGRGDGMAKGDGSGVPVDDPQHETPIVVPPVKVADSSPMPSASSTPSTNATPQSVDLGLAGETKFAALFNSLTTYQLDELPLEAEAGKTIVQAAAECR
jgi:hypothetical protein